MLLPSLHRNYLRVTLQPGFLLPLPQEHHSVFFFCAQAHNNFKCPRLLTLSSSQRKQLLHDHQLCELCLNSHSTLSFAYKWRCRICNGKHNTMIHMDPLVSNFGTDGSRVLLATALIKVTGDNGRSRTLRVLIDQGSQSSFVSQEVARELQLPYRSTNVTIGGIGGKKFTAQGATTFCF